MSENPKEGLDRRDFMIASIATVGASAALAVNAGAAKAEDTSTSAGAAARDRRTVYTGDVIDGKKVVSALDVNDLEPGRKHLLYFQGVEMATGQHWYVSVMVAKGAKPGKRAVLVSGVHGDEMSSVHTVQTVMTQLDPAQMAGTVMAVTDVSRPAIEGMQRRWPNSGRGIDLIDMNREWPGNENGATAPSRHAGLLFNRLLRPNADFAIDFQRDNRVRSHRIQYRRNGRARDQGNGRAYPSARSSTTMYIPASCTTRLSTREFRRLRRRSAPPAALDLEMVSLFVEGTMNVLKHHGIVAGPMGRTGKDVNVFVGNSAFPILATAGGLVEHLVKLNDKVEAGQKVAIQRNSFGEVVAEYTSGVAGEITGQRSDAMSEPGNPLVFILFNNATPEAAQAYPE